MKRPNTEVLIRVEITLHFMTTVSWATLKVMFMYLFNIILCGLFEVMFKGTSELVEQSDLLTVLQKACGCRCLVCKEQPIRQTTITFTNNPIREGRFLTYSPAMMTLSLRAGPNLSVISCLCLWTAKWSSFVNRCGNNAASHTDTMLFVTSNMNCGQIYEICRCVCFKWTSTTNHDLSFRLNVNLDRTL